MKRRITHSQSLIVWYQKQLKALVDTMQKEIDEEIKKLLAERKKPTPKQIQAFVDAINKKYAHQYQQFANKLSPNLANKIINDTLRRFKSSFRGQTVIQNGSNMPIIKFNLQGKSKEWLRQVVINRNVNYIKDLFDFQKQKLSDIALNALTEGKGKADIYEYLRKARAMSIKRAYLISGQIVKEASERVLRESATEAGLYMVRWRHSAISSKPRISHLKAAKMDNGKGKLFDLREGCLIDGEYIFPHTKINCNCFYTFEV